MSAVCPTAITPPLSFPPNRRAGICVAARNAAAGDSPADTNSSSSLCSDAPGSMPMARREAPCGDATHVPAELANRFLVERVRHGV